MSEGVRVGHVCLSLAAIVAAAADVGYKLFELSTQEKEAGVVAKLIPSHDNYGGLYASIFVQRVTRENIDDLLKGEGFDAQNSFKGWVRRSLRGDTELREALEDGDVKEVFQIVFDGDCAVTREKMPRLIQRYKFHAIQDSLAPGRWVEEIADANGVIQFAICENDNAQEVTI
jgi:hypothetical protein